MNSSNDDATNISYIRVTRGTFIGYSDAAVPNHMQSHRCASAGPDTVVCGVWSGAGLKSH